MAKEVLITDSVPEVKKFKEERLKKRKENKEKIRKKLSEVYIDSELDNCMDTLYPNKAPNQLIPAKKYLSDFGKSASLEHQKKALDSELDKRGELWSEVDRLYMEGVNFKKCTDIISKIKKSSSGNNIPLEKGIEMLEKQGPSVKVVKYFEKLLNNSQSISKPSRYSSALANVLVRQNKNLKPMLDKILSFISENEQKFKGKFKNSLSFNQEVETKLSELKKCNNTNSLENFLSMLIK